jgi:hypothetical protein
MNTFSRSIFVRSLMTGAVFLTFMMASAAVVRAQTVIGADGAPGADCSTEGCHAGNGDGGESVIGGDTAIGGVGGSGGTAFAEDGWGGFGGGGGAASASGTNATAVGGGGGAAGDFFFVFTGFAGYAGNGGDATATSSALSNGPNNATSAATATGGTGGQGILDPEIVGAGAGGNAAAASSATANGSGNAISSATATSGAIERAFSENNASANVTATSTAIAKGSGGATASATASGGVSISAATTNATSYAETAKGGLAQAQAPAEGGGFGQSQSTAKTDFGGVRAQSFVEGWGSGGDVSTDAIAQGGSGQSPVETEQSAFAFSTALPSAGYATMLIGSASNVADALLGPDDTIFGTAILGGFGSSSTFDFSFRRDLLLGVVTDGGFDIIANGKDILFEDKGDNGIIDLGSTFGPNIDLTIDGEGVFVLGEAVPEPSTWAMMLLGFAGLGYVGYRRARESRAA